MNIVVNYGMNIVIHYRMDLYKILMNISNLSNGYCSNLSNESLNLSNDIGEIVERQMA